MLRRIQRFSTSKNIETIRDEFSGQSSWFQTKWEQRSKNSNEVITPINKTVFEYIDNKRNTQNTICAGGRYDLLFENLCGKKVPALGFAIGTERLLEYF